MAELFGVPAADRAKFSPWVQAVTALQDQTLQGASIDGDQPADGLAAVGELLGYFSDVIAERRTHNPDPDRDLLSALVAAEVEGDRLDDWDILGFCFVVTAGGADTTAALIDHLVMLLSANPSQRELLLADLGLIEQAILEALRVEPSVQALARTTTEPITVHGAQIPAGQKVLMLYGSANRDQAEFGPDADQFRIQRQFTRHLGFGSGPHFCIGSHLARLQVNIAATQLLQAFPQLTVDAAAGVRHPSPFVRGWRSLPIVSL